jgi:MFS family permease
MNRVTVGGAIAPLLATSAVQAAASLTMFSVAVVAAVAAPEIGVQATSIGTFMAIAYGAAMLAGLMTGALLDRYGAVRIGQVAMLLAFAGVVCLAISNPLAALFSAVLLGFSYGPVNPFSTHILARVVPEPHRSLFFSIKQSSQPAGTALAGAALPLLVLAFDWRAAIIAAGSVPIVAALCIQPLRGRLDAARNPALALRAGNVLAPLRFVLGQANLRRLTLSGFLLSGTQVSLASFFVIYLTGPLSLSLTAAGLMFTVMQVGGVIGRLLWGAMADRLLSANFILRGLAAATAALSIAIVYFPNDLPGTALAVLSFMLGATSHGWNGIFFSELVRSAPADRVGEAASGAQFGSLAGVAVAPALFGLIVTLSGSYFPAFAMTAGAMIVTAFYLRLSAAPSPSLG